MHGDPFTVVGVTYVPLTLLAVVAMWWFWWNVYTAGQQIEIFYRQVRRWRLARREERLLVHYRAGPGTASTVTRARASQGAAPLPQESPCRRTTAPADRPSDPWPTRTRTPRGSVSAPR